jgi:hypothetical protein
MGIERRPIRAMNRTIPSEVWRWLVTVYSNGLKPRLAEPSPGPKL